MPTNRAAEFDRPLPSDVLLILLALASRPMHGYAIIREVEDRSNNEVRLQTGALYRYLHRLLRGGLIVECRPAADEANADSRRRYYKLADRGEAVLTAEIDRMALLVRAAKLTARGRRPRLA